MCSDERVVDALRDVTVKLGEMNDRYGVIQPWIDELGCDIGSLWEPYVKGSDSRSGGGSGLGLFVVKTVLDKYGLKGRLEYEHGIFSVIIMNK